MAPFNYYNTENHCVFMDNYHSQLWLGICSNITVEPLIDGKLSNKNNKSNVSILGHVSIRI